MALDSAPRNQNQEPFTTGPRPTLNYVPGQIGTEPREIMPPAKTEKEKNRNKSLGKKFLAVVAALVAGTGATVAGVNALSHDEKSPNPRNVAVGPAVPGPETSKPETPANPTVTPTPEQELSLEERAKLIEKEWEERREGLVGFELDFEHLIATAEEVDTINTVYSLGQSRTLEHGETNVPSMMNAEVMQNLTENSVLEIRESAQKLFSDPERLQKIIDGANTRWGKDIEIDDIRMNRKDLSGTPEQAAAKINNVTANLTYLAAEIQLTSEQSTEGEETDKDTLTSRDVLSIAAALDSGRDNQQDIIDQVLSTGRPNVKAGEVDPSSEAFAYITSYSAKSFIMEERPGGDPGTTAESFNLPWVVTAAEIGLGDNPNKTPVAASYMFVPIDQETFVPVLVYREGLKVHEAN